MIISQVSVPSDATPMAILMVLVVCVGLLLGWLLIRSLRKLISQFEGPNGDKPLDQLFDIREELHELNQQIMARILSETEARTRAVLDLEARMQTEHARIYQAIYARQPQNKMKGS
jgi:predicted PurR-regulated permease PerM